MTDRDDVQTVNKSRFLTDSPGVNPKQFANATERAAFEQAREVADRPAQAVKTILTVPQEGQDLTDYRFQIACEIVTKTNLKGAATLLTQAASVNDVEQAVFAAALTVPEQKGELARITSVDRSGREIHEFIGAKSSWMSRFQSIGQVGPFVDENGKPMRTPVIL